jgi:hypothetical protein
LIEHANDQTFPRLKAVFGATHAAKTEGTCDKWMDLAFTLVRQDSASGGLRVYNSAAAATAVAV